MPLASLANLHWNGPASLAAVDDAAAEEAVTPKAYGNLRTGEDAVSGAEIAMTRVRSMELADDATSDAQGYLKQVSSIRFGDDVGAQPSAAAIARALPSHCVAYGSPASTSRWGMPWKDNSRRSPRPCACQCARIDAATAAAQAGSAW